MGLEKPAWHPTTIRRFVKAFSTGAGVVLVETDQGKGYLKGMGNPGGDHLLACEWVGTLLARRLGLPTFDFYILRVTEHDELPFAAGGMAKAGPAFVTRAERGGWWSGAERDLRVLANPHDIPRLVLFDTWMLNCDRYSVGKGRERVHPDNVFFSREGAPRGRFILKAMDHTHCLTCGKELSPRLAAIDRIRDEQIYGLFPQFRRFMVRRARAVAMQDHMRDALGDLGGIGREEVHAAVQSVPAEWGLHSRTREAVTELIWQRSRFLLGNMMRLARGIWPQLLMPFIDAKEEDQ
ncbi:MAG: hypothetical protein FJ291_28475 [Planctomycetes bacterium]|nr:hypothetical protein [Planctomycetota bacterium]